METGRVLDWLLAHPDWHSGLELVEAGLTSRQTVYSRLAILEDRGQIELRVDPEKPTLRSHQFRAALGAVYQGAVTDSIDVDPKDL